jgi:hypothetical protein
LLDDFYLMEVNRTAATVNGNDENEGQMLFISQVVSNNFRNTLLNCFAFTLQAYIQAKVNWNSFPNDEERGTSFLFNMLEHSFEIRANTENLIIYGNSEDYVNYAKYSGALVQDLIYFTFDVGSSKDGDDNEIVYHESNPNDKNTLWKSDELAADNATLSQDNGKV